jgi:hypothetical protein
LETFLDDLGWLLRLLSLTGKMVRPARAFAVACGGKPENDIIL